MQKQQRIALGILLLAIMIPVLWAGAIDWIQYDERLAGEDSPFYEDVLNRPTKQIWGVYTSEHNVDGSHRFLNFPTPLPTATPKPDPTPMPTATPITIPTPLPTATPIPDNALIDWTSTTANFFTSGVVDLSWATSTKPKIYYDTSEPDIPNDSFAFWIDGYTGQFWLIFDSSGSQKKVELL
jgi:hypothetical protein